MKRGGSIKRKTPMDRGSGFKTSRPWPGTLRVEVQTRPASTHDDGVLVQDLADTPRGLEAAEAMRRAMENRQRSIEAGSPAYAPLPEAPKRAPKGDGSFTRYTKDSIMHRDGGCVRCGATSPLNYQHRQARAMGGTNDPAVSAVTNGILLCGSGTTGCHGWVELHPAEAEDAGWSVPSWADPASVPVLVYGVGWVQLTATGGRTVLPEAPPQHSAIMVAVRKEDS